VETRGIDKNHEPSKLATDDHLFVSAGLELLHSLQVAQAIVQDEFAQHTEQAIRRNI
jgi:hypothetical protein